ncbi:GFA family protein [Agarivorans aestuarii]|uniref:GFA family protein n=1 Tax=Agarivorans aestuarii TaxID=1563703 RepID=A0ABU7G199_9ALTE|nr:GFA family protein [Agarivorans aestuarii]MEE1673118.1 GFA family protein [Agarivorans aestuarii]
MTNIKGSCLCDKVQFEAEDKFQQFHLCHCDQCKKMSGSAHVSNLFIKPDYFNWLAGEELVSRYDVPERSISNAFCQQCGSAVPYLSSSKQWVIVPAGGLNSSPSLKPQDHIFTQEKAEWYQDIDKLKQYPGFPD